MITQIRTRISSVFLIQEEKTVLVDTGNPGELNGILRAMRALGVAPRDLSLILQTHGHADHAGNTYELQKLSGAPVAIHPADADMLRRGINGPLIPTSLSARFIRMFMATTFAGVEPDIVIDSEAIDLTPFGIDVKFVFIPGHTPGSIAIVTKEQEVIAGDLLMGGVIGGHLVSGRPCYHYFAEDLPQLRQSIQKMMRLSPKKVYVSHGGPLDPTAIRRKFPATTVAKTRDKV